MEGIIQIALAWPCWTDRTSWLAGDVLGNAFAKVGPFVDTNF